MTDDRWQQAVGGLQASLAGLSFRDGAGAELGAEVCFDRWQALSETLRKQRGTIYLIGNGASASMASHMAAVLAKNGKFHTQVFSDLSLITAISNDMGYEHVFSEPLRRRARRGDMLVAISSSGASPNILAAVWAARALSLTVVTLSAMQADNPLRSMGDLNAWVAAESYGTAETCHAAVLHHWMDRVALEAR